MGQSQSSPPSALQTCLNTNACHGSTAACVGYPSDPLYQLNWVQPWNLAVNVTPAAVVRPSSADDVAAVVLCAAASGLAVQARSGGHSYANIGLGGGSQGDQVVAVDLVNMAQFSMDTTTWQATIGPAVRLGDVTQKLIDNGNRAFAHGVCPGVGLGGHATVGGLGPMSRMWGTCLDHVVEAEVVTANGTVVRASDTQNSDLFFAIRGAGTNFGIVTEFVMRTHPAPGDVVQYSYTLTFGSAASIAPLYSQWQAVIADPDLDRRFGSEFVLHALGAVITGTFYGTEDEWQASGIPDRLPGSGAGNGTLSIAVADWLEGLAHEAENEALYLPNAAVAMYSKSLAFRTEDLLPADSISSLFTAIDQADKGTPIWFIIFDASGGAIGDVPMNATAYAHRDKVLFYQSYAVDLQLVTVSATTKQFLQDFHDDLLALLPSSGTYGTYPGYIDLALAQPQEEYYMSNLDTLAAIKAKWDPENVFRNAQSIKAS